jgi:two-component system NtrC family sensor kinase
VHSNQPVLYVVDLAPLILGATGYGLGVFHSRLIRIRHSIEETVKATTAELQHALQDLAATQAELLNSQKMEAIRGLAAGIAHEINTPIQYVSDSTRFVEESLAGLIDVAAAAESLVNAVKDVGEVAGLVQAYEQVARDADIEFLAEEIPSALEESLEGIGQVASIVKALKSFAHPGTSNKSPDDLNEIITTTVAVSRNEWKYVAEMDLSGLDRRLPKVPVNAGPLKQVILNIVVNAAHAIEPVSESSGEKGSIRIATAIEGTNAVIRITDSGGGIPESIRDRILEPFFTTKDVGQGSGQGLAIAQSIVDNHNGELSFESTMNQGTTFTITLPLQAKPSPVNEALTPA